MWTNLFLAHTYVGFLKVRKWAVAVVAVFTVGNLVVLV